MNRREVLKAAASLAAAHAVDGFGSAARPGYPILDAHIHLFDPTRPGGVVWPLKDDAVLYKPALPARHEQVTRGMGVVGAIAIEASPVASDNDWVLAQCAANDRMVGMIGDLVPGASTFAAELARLHGNPLFLGIRYGNLWDHDLYADLKKPEFVEDVRRVAAAELVFESANPDARLVEGLLSLSQQIPELRIVVDHLPNAKIPEDAGARKQFWANLKSLGQNERVVIKISEVPVVGNGKLIADPAYYREKLDPLWEIFGENRVIFGSDWPNSDHVAGYAETLGIVRTYVTAKGPDALGKYFFRNSLKVYRWKARRPDQKLGLV
jgi:predicted TIM-barrel fold metal-dependent hydrolase